MHDSKTKPNRLIDQSSPYLLQHAHNPVEWHPWDQEALDLARNEEKPILLSIGYSACHWCHVMERESFEVPGIAAIMNDLFVCIKVDREERPDLDKIYQLSHQMFNRRAGGWPLTAFLSHDEHVPIYVGTYFPPEPRGGMPGFPDVLRRVSDHYRTNRAKLAENYQQLKDALSVASGIPEHPARHESEQLLEFAVQELINQYDPVYGGFGAAPKFPHSTHVSALLRFARRQGIDERKKNMAVTMAVHTLDAMADGGLYDHVGGGFYRYSVDERWEIPHFEKMLYDNALLMPLYAQVAVAKDRPDLRAVALDSAQWVMREMQSPAGGYYSTLDADSEGHEGKFYVWTPDELDGVLTSEDLSVTTVRYGLRGMPNFEGSWHLRVVTSIDKVAERCNIDDKATRKRLKRALGKLFKHRQSRTRPDRDEKILASWNGLMIGAMAQTGRLLNQPALVESAAQAVEFIRRNMWIDGRLRAAAKDERAYLNAYLDDCVFLADGLFELLRARWSDADMRFMIELLDLALARYLDEARGALYFTSDDHESLISRVTPTNDEATPSSNAIAARLLMQVGWITGEERYVKAGERIVEALRPAIENMPSAFGSALCAIEEKLYPQATAIIRGSAEEVMKWSKAIADKAPPDAVVLAIPDGARHLPGLLAERAARPSTVAYVCRQFVCSAPCDTIKETIKELSD